MSQLNEFNEVYTLKEIERWSFHTTADPLIRYLRDRRLNLALDIIKKNDPGHSLNDTILILCGGVGGEAYYFIKNGYINTTNSDFFDNVDLASKLIFNSSFKTLQLDALNTKLSSESFDYVVIQDGLHHLNGPVTGMVEMLRVCKKGIIVIEPHTGIVGELFGTKWENIEGNINWVFRWNKNIFTQSIQSFLLKRKKKIIVRRIWDHNLAIGKICSKFPKRIQVRLAKLIYGFFNLCLPSTGNMFIGVLIKESNPPQV